MKNFVFILILIIAMLVSGCSALQPAQVNTQPLIVSYTQWSGDYTVLVAQELGLFDKYGVKVDARYYEIYSASLGDILAGKTDCILAGGSDVITLATRGNFKTVLIQDDGGAASIVASPDILDPADLKGKRIGVNVGTPREIHVYRMLEQAGLKVTDVILVDMNPEQVPEKLGVEIQAGYVWEPYTAQAVKLGNRLIYTTAGTPGIKEDVDIVLCRAEVTELREEAVWAFTQAWFEAVDYRLSNPLEADMLIANVLGLPVEDVAGDALLLTRQDNVEAFVTPTPGEPSTIFKVLQGNLDFLISVGEISIYPDLDTLVDGTFIQ